MRTTSCAAAAPMESASRLADRIRCFIFGLPGFVRGGLASAQAACPWLRNCCRRADFGAPKNASSGPSSSILPLVQEDRGGREVARHCACRGSRGSSCALLGERADDADHLLFQLGSRAEVGSSKRSARGSMHSVAGDGGALLLAARQLRGPGIGLFADADLVEIGAGAVLDLRRGPVSGRSAAPPTFCRMVRWDQRLTAGTHAEVRGMRRTCSASAGGGLPRPPPTGSPSKVMSPCWLSSSS